MLFNSLGFAFFFPIVTLGYFLLPYRFRWLWLLLASCIFYMAAIPVYILVLFFLILIDYTAGIFIEKSTGGTRKGFLVMSLAANIGILGFFKYYNFFNVNLSALAHFIGWNYSMKTLNLLLPIGLSFHTFQAMAYTIEVYRGNQKAERHFGIYALYVMFFPQLVAGPIERPYNLIHQFYEQHDFDYGRVTDGLRLMAWGLFKKVVIADRLALFVRPVYANPTEYHGLTLSLATFFFAFQIYCDFSGYSDMAIGAARVLGFRLMKNFNSPYLATSISEFWKRWHISLSTWFRDYLYIPLGGNRVSLDRLCFNLMVVFLISGFWHGANWTFIIWGALHGFYYVSSVLTKRLFLKSPEFLATAITFSLVCFAWIFFRAESMADGCYIATHLFSGLSGLTSVAAIKEIFQPFFYFENAKIYFVVTLGLIFCLEWMERTHFGFLQKKPTFVRWAAYYALIFVIIVFGRFDTSKFIYFQF